MSAYKPSNVYYHHYTLRTLLSLPSELVEQILDSMAPSTLPAVRQTCKTLASLSATSFGSKVLA
ncbi:hypothetical protein D6D11_09605 [Aureobasidium pullulans]|nr:hypothetical protein D6D11_09605 [Aureobasidium pullulans]